MKNFSLIFVCFIAIVVISQSLTPILLVPGLIGSNLEARLEKSYRAKFQCKRWSDWYEIWISIRQLTTQWTCFKDNMMLHYNPATNTYKNTEGVYIRGKNFGGTHSVEYIHPLIPGGFKGFVSNFTEKHNYVRNKSISAVPYDFRRTPRSNPQWMVDTKAIIQDLYEQNGKSKVLVVSQSMGCPTFLYFLNQQTQEWKDKYIDQWVSGGGVFAGTSYIVANLIFGEDLSLPLTGYVFPTPHDLRDIFQTWESFYWLQPNKEYWGKDEIIVQIGQKKYSAHDFEELHRDIGNKNGYLKYVKAKEVNAGIIAPGVKFVHAYSKGVPTVSRWNFQDKESTKPERQYGDGDGTVSLRSLQSTLKWHNEQIQKITEIEYTNVQHAAIVDYPPFIKLVEELIFNQIENDKIQQEIIA